MARGRELPPSFHTALTTAQEVLSTSHELREKNLIITESEQLVVAAYRKATGKTLSRVELFTRIGDRFPEAAGEELLNMAGARAAGKPLQYVAGFQAFLDHEYSVGPEVLIPRPETEVLVSLAIQTLKRCISEPRLGLEIGIGSGILSIELLSAFPQLSMVASEVSERAIALAKENANKILGGAKAARLNIIQSEDPLSVWQPFEFLGTQQADFLISNPPYLLQPEAEPGVHAYEPHVALFAPVKEPLYYYQEIAQSMSRFIKLGGYIFLEIPHERSQAIAGLYRKCGFEAEIHLDLNNRERVLVARKIGEK